MREDLLPATLCIPLEECQSEIPVFRLEMEELDLVRLQLLGLVDSTAHSPDNQMRSFLCAILKEFSETVGELKAHNSQLTKEISNFRRRELNTFQRSHSTNSWHEIYLYKAIEASFDSWSLKTRSRNWPFRMLRNGAPNVNFLLKLSDISVEKDHS